MIAKIISYGDQFYFQYSKSLNSNLLTGSKKQGSCIPLMFFFLFATFPDRNDPSSFTRLQGYNILHQCLSYTQIQQPQNAKPFLKVTPFPSLLKFSQTLSRKSSIYRFTVVVAGRSLLKCRSGGRRLRQQWVECFSPFDFLFIKFCSYSGK